MPLSIPQGQGTKLGNKVGIVVPLAISRGWSVGGKHVYYWPQVPADRYWETKRGMFALSYHKNARYHTKWVQRLHVAPELYVIYPFSRLYCNVLHAGLPLKTVQKPELL